MIKYLKKSNSKRIENEIQELYIKKKYDNVISSYKTFIANEKVSTKVKQIVALSYFYNKDYENSLILFEEINLVKEETESLFNVLMSLLRLGKIDKARDVFAKLIKSHKGLVPNQARELSVPYIKYYYAYGLTDSGLFEEAFTQLNDLIDIYADIKETDDTFLYMRGIPFLTQLLDLARNILGGMKMDIAYSDCIIKLDKNIDSKGKRTIKDYIKNI